jgi:uncharacterized protein
MSRTVWAGCLSLFAVIIPVASLAVTVEEVPNPRQVNGGWVTDLADVLTPAAETQINQLVLALEAQNGSEVAVVTVPTTEPLTAREFATALFERWGIGKQGQDNGVLFLIAVDDRRTEIETGYGTEAVLPDARAGRILDQSVIPYFRAGDYETGILSGTEAIVSVLSAAAFDPADPAIEPSPGVPFGFWAVMLGGAGALAIGYRQMRAMATRPREVAPEGHSRWRGRSERPIHCAVSHNPMQPLPADVLQPRLTHPEQVAQQLGSTVFAGWQCPVCHPKLPDVRPSTWKRTETPGFHLIAHEVSHEFGRCPNCEELTVISTTKVLRQATQFTSGIQVSSFDCQACGYHSNREEHIPRIAPPVVVVGGGGFGGGGFGGGGSSGGGGSFGGGSSGGGGAGRGW